MNKDLGTEIRKERIGIGTDILIQMDKEEELPMPNKYRLAKTMAEYFIKGDYVDTLEHSKKWRGTADYWMSHLSDVCAMLREQHRYFEYVPDVGGKGFTGQWKFTSKQEYETKLRWEHADIGTRTENHNDKVTDGNEKWKLNVPVLPDVPRLTD
uniref:Uncharacterized protein n=1 Tax=viral metagenome TaxID=1070528 RepID=A0A6M3LFG8_9ZZZZ